MNTNKRHAATTMVKGTPRPLTSSARRVLWAAALLLLTTQAAPAEQVEVRIYDRYSGEPLAGVAVCLGTPADAAQFGAVHTDTDGVARFPLVPPTPITLTASKAQYRSTARELPGQVGDRTIVSTLSRGGGGPACVAPQARVAVGAVPQTLRVKGLRVSRPSADSKETALTLEPVVEGNPTHYRLSQDRGFANAQWQPYADRISLAVPSGPAGGSTVYFQVRQYQDRDGVVLERTSNVLGRRLR